MRQSTTRSVSPILWVLLLVLAFLIVCPLVSVFAEAVIIDGRLDLYRAWTIIAAPENLQTIWNSLLLGVCVVALSTASSQRPPPTCWPAANWENTSGWTSCSWCPL